MWFEDHVCAIESLVNVFEHVLARHYVCAELYVYVAIEPHEEVQIMWNYPFVIEPCAVPVPEKTTVVRAGILSEMILFEGCCGLHRLRVAVAATILLTVPAGRNGTCVVGIRRGTWAVDHVLALTQVQVWMVDSVHELGGDDHVDAFRATRNIVGVNGKKKVHVG
jgi:hypothetical protein